MNETREIRIAELADLSELSVMDHLLDSERVQEKIRRREILVCHEGERVIAFLRYSWFWDLLPFINLIWVEEEFRRERLGSLLIEKLAEETQEKNYKMILTSTQSNEDAQNFYRRIGFVDSGGLTIKGEPLELLMINYLPKD